MADIGPQRLGRAVQIMRGTRGLTQRDLAARARVRAQRLSDIEAGRGNPTFATVEAIARGLGIKASELLAAAERLR